MTRSDGRKAVDLDPKTPPRPRGNRPRIALPMLIPVLAIAAAMGAAFWDGCEEGPKKGEMEQRAVSSSAAVAERVMEGYEAGEVSAMRTQEDGPLATGPERMGADTTASMPLRPDGGSPGQVVTEQQSRAAVESGATSFIESDSTWLTPHGRHMEDDTGIDIAREADKALREARVEMMKQALSGSSRVELGVLNGSGGRRPPTSQGHQASATIEAFEKASTNAQQDYVAKLAELQQAGLLGGSSTGSGSSSKLGMGDDYRRFGGTGDTDRWDLGQQVQETSPYTLVAGAVIPAILQTGLDSELPGPISALVAQDVRDTATGAYVLIPQGARLLGVYDANVRTGQERLLVAWQRIVFPDATVLDLGAMPGLDGTGKAGFADQVHSHFWQLARSALLMSAVTGGVGLSQRGGGEGNNGQSFGQTMSQALGQQFGQLSEEMIRRQMNVAPTLEIRPGYRLNVGVVKDVVFERPYCGFECIEHVLEGQ